MRICALDIGEKRTGIAISDATKTFARPFKVVATKELTQKGSALYQLIEDEEICEIVVGLPLSRSGEEGAQASFSRRTAAHLQDAFGVSIHFQDERFTSAEAKRIMHEQGYSERDMRGKLDAVAASLLLETYLEEHKERP